MYMETHHPERLDKIRLFVSEADADALQLLMDVEDEGTFVMLQDGAKLNPFCIPGTLAAEPVMHLKRENSEFDLQLVQVYPRMSTGGGTVVAEGDGHAEGQ
jgi:hypothetical protein